ncbi:MAG: PKD domain-containing protein [Flavobacteriales bacterium]
MNQPLRSLLYGAALLVGSMAFAQPTPPFAVTISGEVTPCSPANSSVNITSVQGTLPNFSIDVPLDSNCSYSVTMIMDSWQGWFQVGTPCAGAMQYNTGSYAINALDSTASVVIDISCGGGGGNCQAAFVVQQAMNGSTPIPWEITTTNLATGTPPWSFEWWMPDASNSSEAEPGFTFTEPGIYGICLNVWTDDGACSATHCDTLVVDDFGNITIGQPCTPPTITGIPGPLSICSTDTLILSVSATGTAPLLYYWTGPGITYTDTLSSYAYAEATPGTYQVSVVNACGTADGSVSVSVAAAPDAGIGTDNFSCDLSGPTSLFSLLDGTPNAGGTWTFGGAAHGPMFDPQTDMPGAYVYTVAGTAPCADDMSWVYIMGVPSWYDDSDGDGFGDPLLPPIISCTQPAGYVSNNGDDCPEIFGDLGSACDDGDPATINDHITIDCLCEGSIVDCLGIPGGSALPGTSCTVSGTTIPGIWSTSCACVPDTTGCNACIITVQDSTPAGLLPFTAQISSCSTGDGPFTYLWHLPDGLTSTHADTTVVFPGADTYLICLTLTDNSGCTSFTCDTLVVDANGTITPYPSPACEAGFWTIQAYDSTAGGVSPIPNEVWVWNLSSGGNGNYQYQWNFGDGTGSTDPFPTHTYSGPGPWLLCLTMQSGNCTDTYCDSVSVDADGMLNQLVIGGDHGIAGEASSSGARSGGFTLNVIQQIPTSISEIPAFTDLKVWPNPVNDALNISFNNSMIGAAQVTVIEPSGRTVISESHSITNGGNTLRIPTDKLEQGLYMVRIGNGAKSVTKRFLKVQ